MEDIERDWDKPVAEAGIAAKASVIVRVGMLDLGAGTGSFRVREMMHRIAYPLGVHVRADVNLTDIEASCTDGKDRITEVVDLPTTGVNTERIWLLEHFADWFNVNLGKGSMYHSQSDVSEGLMQHLDKRDASQVSADLSKRLRERQKAEQNQEGSDDPVLDALEMVTERAEVTDTTAQPLHLRDIEAASEQHNRGEREAERETKRETAGTANVTSSESTTKKARKNRNHKPPKGQYAEHFDHVGKEADQSQGITVRQAHERLDMIERRKPLYSPVFAGFASACACASFVFLLGGGPFDMIGAFIGAGLGHWLRRRLFAHHLNQFFVTFVCVAVAALACTGTLRLIGIFEPVAYLIIFIAAWGNSVFTMVVAVSASLMLRVIKLVQTRTGIEQGKAYVMCAVASGARPRRILFVHILPNLVWDVLHFICLSCADMTLSIVSFSFIGLGMGDNVVDWGSMVSETHHYLLSYPGLTLYPVLMIVVCTMAFHTLGRWIERRVSARA